jgi:hypothetical protein
MARPRGWNCGLYTFLVVLITDCTAARINSSESRRRVEHSVPHALADGFVSRVTVTRSSAVQ